MENGMISFMPFGTVPIIDQHFGPALERRAGPKTARRVSAMIRCRAPLRLIIRPLATVHFT